MEAVAVFLTEAMRTADPAYIAHAVGVVWRVLEWHGRNFRADWYSSWASSSTVRSAKGII